MRCEARRGSSGPGARESLSRAMTARDVTAQRGIDRASGRRARRRGAAAVRLARSAATRARHVRRPLRSAAAARAARLSASRQPCRVSVRPAAAGGRARGAQPCILRAVKSARAARIRSARDVVSARRSLAPGSAPSVSMRRIVESNKLFRLRTPPLCVPDAFEILFII